VGLVSVPDLRYTADGEPGIRRRRAGRGFMYLDSGGRTVRDANVLERIRGLAVPPAWTDVWICASPDGHLQATGRDQRGRKQYRYHAQWRSFREHVKFDHLVEFGLALPKVRRRVDRDLARRDIGRERVIAAVVRLLELTTIRVGNEEYARENDSYGLTTLRSRHARIQGKKIELVFRGKSGVQHRASIEDRRVARVLHDCLQIPGQHLFQYVEDEAHRAVQSGDVNDYLRECAATDVTAKDYRTWLGTLLAAAGLAALPPPGSEREAKRCIRQMLERVSTELRNTPAVCRASYVHPLILEEYTAGRLHDQWMHAARPSPRALIAPERRLLVVLGSARPRRRDATPARLAA
jgi:DNA topoisomerase-1